MAAVLYLALPSSASTSLVQGSVLNLPNQVGNPSALSDVYKIIGYGSYYYALTTDQGIWRITTSDFTSGGGSGWTAFNTGLPQFSPPAYLITDMSMTGSYLYVVCSNTTTTQQIYRCNLASSTSFSSVSPSPSLNASQFYILQGVGNYMYVCNQANATYDIRYSLNSTTTWTSLTLSVGGSTPVDIASTVVVDLSGPYNLQFCCYNGLFIQNLNSSGAPATATAYLPAFGNIGKMGCINNASGYFAYGFVSENTCGVHCYYDTLERLVSGLSSPYPTNMPHLAGVRISDVAVWNGLPHFGVMTTGVGSITNILYVGNATCTTFGVSTQCTSVSPLPSTSGSLCLYGGDPARLLVSVWGHAIWYTTNTACKTDDIADLNDPEGVTVYPLPAGDEITVSYHTPNNSKPEIMLYDIQGKEQYAPATFSEPGVAKVDVSALSKGVYLLQLINEETKVTKRIIKN